MDQELFRTLYKQACGREWRYDFDEYCAETLIELVVRDVIDIINSSEDGDIDYIKFLLKGKYGVF